MCCSVEMEVKLQVLPSVEGGPAAFFERLAGVDSLGGLRLGDVQPIDIRDVYFDTPDGRLAAARAGLRLRIENGKPLITLKVTRQQSGALSEREEYEYPLDEAGLDRVLARLRPLIGSEPVPRAEFAAGRPAGPLVPVLEVCTERRARSVGEAATLTLDKVTYPGLAPEAYYDIEVEAEPGLEDPSLLRALEQALTQLAGGQMRGVSQSKLERGLQLRSRRGQTGGGFGSDSTSAGRQSHASDGWHPGMAGHR